MITPRHGPPPGNLPLHYALGGAAMACIYALLHGASITGSLALLSSLNPQPHAPLEGLPGFSWSGWFRSAALLGLAFALAFSSAMTVVMMTRHFFPALLGLLPAAGLLLFAAPVFGLSWAAIGWWVGGQGGVIESLMPPRPAGIGEPASEFYTRKIWEFLAPSLALAVPLAGILAARLADSFTTSPHASLEASLRARGHSRSSILNNHLLPLLWQRWQQSMHASLLAAIVLLILTESAFHFSGWGAAFAANLAGHDHQGIAWGLFSGGLLLALTSACLKPRLFPSAPVAAACPAHDLSARRLEAGFCLFLLAAASWVFLISSDNPLHPQSNRLASGHEWITGWRSDFWACLNVVCFALIGGLIALAARWLIPGLAMRRFTALEFLAWSPLAFWVAAWSRDEGNWLHLDQALALPAAVHLAAGMHRVILRWNDSALLEAARGLGASPLQAWRHHALIPCLRELIGRMAGLVASVWWLRIACLCLLPPEQADPSVSVGSFLSRAADNALLQPMPLVSASLAGAVSILFFWTLRRIITPPSFDDI